MVVELRLAVAVLGLLLLVAALAAIWFDRRANPARAHPRLFGGRWELTPALEDLPMGFVLLEDGAISYATREARRVLGLGETTAQVPDQPWWGDLREDLARLARDRSSRPQRVIRVGTERYARWVLANVDGARQILFVEDISAQQRAERTTRFLLEAVSHELRTPLTAMLAHAALLRSTATLDTDSRRSAEFVYRETLRISRLTNELLDLTRLGAAAELVMRPVDLLMLVG